MSFYMSCPTLNSGPLRASFTCVCARTAHSYKRAFGAIRSTIPDGQAIFDQSHALQMFLANPVHPKQLIFFNLRSELKKIDGHEEVLTEMLTQCTDFLERGIFVTPDDK